MPTIDQSSSLEEMVMYLNPPDKQKGGSSKLAEVELYNAERYDFKIFDEVSVMSRASC